MSDELILNPPIPHGAAATQGTASASFSATSAASYEPTGSGTSTISTALTAKCVRHVTVANLSTSANLFVTVGNTSAVPPAPGSNGSGFAIAAGSAYTFRVPGAGTIGVQGFVKCVASAEGASLCLNWHQ